MNKTLLSILLWILTSTLCSASEYKLRISEFMASNKSVAADFEGDFSDWIEIHNAGTKAVNLEGWSLSDDPSKARKWVFPAVEIKAGDYLLVFASDKNIKDPQEELHCNFKLSSAGEYLALFSPEGIIFSCFDTYPALETDVSYGYIDSCLFYFEEATPGQPNEKSNAIRLVTPVFSHPRGYYDTAFVLTIQAPVPGADIYYTLDGSLPIAGQSALYEQALSITGNTILRTICAKENYLPSKASTLSYLFIDDILNQSNSPEGYPEFWGSYAQITGTAIADYEMDSELIGEPAYANSVREGLSDLPVISVVGDKNHFFSHEKDPTNGGIYIFTGPPVGKDKTGDGWERPVSFEYFNTDDDVSLQMNCGIRIHGGHSRLAEKSPKHSFRLVFRPEFGPARLDFPFFGPEGPEEFNALVLRAGFCNSWIHSNDAERTIAQYIRDAWAKNTQRQMGHPAAYNSYAHLFINGLYWGLYNPSERIDDDFCEIHFGGDKEDYDVIKQDEEQNNVIYASDGEDSVWLDLISALKSTPGQAVYQRIQGKNPDGSPHASEEALLDGQNFIDYMLINFYGGNTDWDHHNWIAVRDRTNPTQGFQIICWDSEHVLKSLSENKLSQNKTNCPSFIFQQLRQCAQFRMDFADRAQKHFFNSGLLSPEGAAGTWTEIADVIDKAVYAESARWGDYRRDVHPSSPPGALYRKDVHYDAQKRHLLENYFPRRSNAFIDQLKAASLFPKVEAPEILLNEDKVNRDTLSLYDVLGLRAAQGSIYYSLDGRDPLDWSGGQAAVLSASSRLYTGAFSPDSSLILKARTLYNNNWSALSEKQFFLKKPVSALSEFSSDPIVPGLTCSPNPLQREGVISYQLPYKASVTLSLYTLDGTKIRDWQEQTLEAGRQQLCLDASDLQPGFYLLRLDARGMGVSCSGTVKLIRK
ncbi:MAG: CotH kinase family protein [Bacteroidales bacterium]|nr:CotH kinase family protein [Bacteroidales bacterium]